MAIIVKDGAGAVRYLPRWDAAYSYVKAGFVPAATAAELIVIQGAAGKVHRLKRLLITGDSGAASINLLTMKLERWSSAGTLGSAALTAITGGKHDSADGTCAATVSSVGTAAYTTPGTVAALIRTIRTTTHSTTFATGQEGLKLADLVWSDADDNGPLVRSASEYLVLTATAVVATARLDINIQLEEGTL